MIFKGSIPSHMLFITTLSMGLKMSRAEGANPQIWFQSHLSVCFRAELDSGPFIIQVLGFLWGFNVMQKTPSVTSLVFLMIPHQGCWKAPGWPLGFSFGPQSEIVFAPLFQSFLLPLFWPHCEGGSIYHPTESGQNIKNWGMKIVFSLLSHSCISFLIVCPHYIYLITLVTLQTLNHKLLL